MTKNTKLTVGLLGAGGAATGTSYVIAETVKSVEIQTEKEKQISKEIDAFIKKEKEKEKIKEFTKRLNAAPTQNNRTKANNPEDLVVIKVTEDNEINVSEEETFSYT